MPSYREQLKHKRGSSFIVSGRYLDEAGVALDLTAAGISITSAVVGEDSRDRFVLIVALANQATNPGEFSLRGETDDWLDDVMLWDILYTQGVVDWASETQRVHMLEQVT